MFKVRKSPTPVITSTSRTSAAQEQTPKTSFAGSTSRDVAAKRVATGLADGSLQYSHGPDGEYISTSDTSMRVTGSPNTTISNNAITIDVDPMLTGMTPQTEHVLHRIYKDIYYNDAIGGSAVDLMSMLPFSDFNLGGLTMKGTQKPREKFLETLNRLNVRSMLPEISTDYLVLGCHVSSLLYNADKRMFTDVMTHQVENVKVEPLPFYSQDPILTVTFPPEVTEIMGRKGSKRMDRLRETLGKGLVDKILQGSLELDPLSTLFLPRRTFTRNDKGTSYYRRILPIYLIEKNLFRGTLVESARRQRGILHASLGDGEQWIPTPQDMEFITELLMNADSDPVGAIIATRSGISIDEIRQGGDFWKVTDFSDSVQGTKMRALGISETLLSGEANYSTSDNGMVVFLDMLRSYREMITHRLFYNRLFPLISLINGFTVKGDSVKIQEDLINQLDSEEAMYQLNDGSKLLIPTVQWTKQLKPEGDSAYIELLNTMTEKGVPVSLRALAAAGGIDIEQLLKQQDEDLALRKDVAEYIKKITALAPQPAEGEDSEASVSRILTLPGNRVQSRSAVLAERGGRPIPILSRDFSSHEPHTLSRTGKPKPVLSATRSAFERRANERIVKSLRVIDTRKGRK